MAARRPPMVMGDSEPVVPRLCVSDAVARALAAVWWLPRLGPVRVYVTEPRRANPPRGVYDATLTGERWLVPPVRLFEIGCVPAEVLGWVQEGLEPRVGFHEPGTWLPRKAELLRRMTLVVSEFVPSARERWVERFAERLCGAFPLSGVVVG